MKTTNKILIAGFIVGLAISTYFILKITSFIQIDEMNPSGYTLSEEISIEEFNAISVDKGVIVNLSYDEQESLNVIADTAFRKYLNVEVEEQTLKIHASKKLPDSLKIIANLVADDLKAITVNNRAKVICNQRLVTESLYVKAGQGGKIDMNVELAYLECDLSGGAQLDISGTTDSIKVKTNDRAKLNAYNFKAKHAMVEAKNHSYVHFYVSGSIDVKAIDGGIVEYSGEPQVTNMEVTEGGKLIKLNE